MEAEMEKEKVDNATEKEDTTEVVSYELYFIKDAYVKEILQYEENREFKKSLIDTVRYIKNRKMVDIPAIKKEIDSLYKNGGVSINLDDYIPEGNFIDMYHHIINDLDAGRSRLLELSSITSSDYACIVDYYEKLNNIWKGCFSKQSSDKKREGEADRVMFFLMHPMISRRDINNLVKARLADVTSKMDAISRKITIAQEMFKFVPGMANEYAESLKLRKPIKIGHNPFGSSEE